MTRGLLALVGATAVLVSTTISALAWSGGVDGATIVPPEAPTGYYIWHDDGFHVRTHGPGEQHFFTARLHTDGVFQNVDTVRLESRDDARIVDGGHTLVLQLHTYGAEDGVNFTISGGTSLRFALDLDGHFISTRKIFLGPDGFHPPSNPFTIHR
ncbi:MAG TPA: hypothetical protein VFC51_06825 [Chloroflexota bacterium]|nr:hypothetical protein [Chloroflexota bacterium]